MRDYTHAPTQEERYLNFLSQSYPSAAAAASEVIRLQAVLKLPKGTEHFMSDLHGESDAFMHILNNASGVIKEKVDATLRGELSELERRELATLIYYPHQKLPMITAQQKDLNAWYAQTIACLIRVCRLVSSKHTRQHVRSFLPSSCGYVLDELLHAHFEDHNKELYHGQIIASIIENDRAEPYIIAFCELIKRLAVDKLHIVGDIFDRGPRPDLILDRLMAHHAVDLQWGNHDVVWMGAAAGSPVCIATVLKTTLAYNNLDTIEEGYGISLRRLAHYAEDVYGGTDLSLWMPHTDENRGPYNTDALCRTATMHKAISIIMFKLECQLIDRNPDFLLTGRDFLRHIDYDEGTVLCRGKRYPLKNRDFPTVDTAHPEQLTKREAHVMDMLVRSFKVNEKLQRHTRFLYDKGSVYHIENGNLLYHGAVPMTEDGQFAAERFEGRVYSDKKLFDYCDHRARTGYFAPEGSAERQSGQDFLWYLWCGALSPLYGRSAMTTFERLYIADKTTHEEVKDPYYRYYNDAHIDLMILTAFGLHGGNHIINGHVPVRAVEGESPIKGGGRLIVIDGGFCRAYHDKTGIAGYTLVSNSRGLSLRTHQPFESTEKAIRQDQDILSSVSVVDASRHRILIEDIDEGQEKKALIEDLKKLVHAYKIGAIQTRG